MDVGVMVTSYNHGDWERLMADDYSRPPTIADPVMVDETLAIGEMVEPLGYDSIWTTEDYGSAYSMRLSPLQWLAYWAGRTSRVDLGTAVVVAPWWNPVRLAHEISVLDVLLRGRNLLLGFGRGVSEHEYASLRVPRGESSDYFHEIVDIPRLADRRERFTYDGEIFKIPATTIRPQPRHKGHLLDPLGPPCGSPSAPPPEPEPEPEPSSPPACSCGRWPPNASRCTRSSAWTSTRSPTGSSWSRRRPGEAHRRRGCSASAPFPSPPAR